MTQKSLHWDGASLGDADALTVNAADGIGWRLGNEDYESPFVDLALRMILNGTGNRGVLLGWLNELAVTGVATPVAVDTGGAIVYGMPYENTVSVNVAVPSPTVDTRQDYIVLRRDWAAQEIRITRIVGVEGGGVPALTQSPAPDGTGIYDVPLASISITVGGVITVTDAREWITMTTEPQDDVFATANLTNESADWTSRQTRTKTVFLGGGDLEPCTPGASQDLFSYAAASYLSDTLGATPAWGNNVVTEEGWYSTLHDTFWIGTLKLPANYAGGDVSVYLWWMVDGGNLGYINSTWQVWGDGETVTYAGEYGRVNCTDSLAGGNGTVYRDELLELSGLGGDELIHYCIEADSNPNQALILGLEFAYTGYL